MQFSYFLKILLLTVSFCNHAKSEYKVSAMQKNEFKRPNSTDLKVGGATVDFASYPWVVAVFDNSDESYRGPSGVINKYWCIAATIIFEQPTVLEGKDVVVYAAIATTADLSSGIIRRGSRRHTNPLRADLNNALTLLKVCPSFSPEMVAPLPEPTQTYSVGTLTTFINYLPDLSAAEKPLGERCECEFTPDWDVTHEVCLEQNMNTYNGNNELGSLLMIDGVFAGINKLGFDDSGEPYFSLKYYLDWIAENTPADEATFCTRRHIMF